MKIQPYIDELQSISSMSGYSLGKARMLAIIEKIEAKTRTVEDCELFYWLGIAYRNYCSWYIRGDERKTFLEKAVAYLKKSYDCATRIPYKSHDPFNWFDRVSIISDLCDILVNERLVRNYDYAEPLLSDLLARSDDYEPAMCSYIQLLYAEKRYTDALVAAQKTQAFIDTSTECNNVPCVQKLIEKIYRKI